MFSLKKLLSPSPAQSAAHAAYLSIVEKARSPVFYEKYGVPDTIDGRFDLIVLHLFMAMRQQPPAEEFNRALAETFFADMDRSLREMGVGDTGVGKRVKNMAEAFYGRLQAYEQGVESKEAMSVALKRNLYRESDVSPDKLLAMTNYVLNGAADFRG